MPLSQSEIALFKLSLDTLEVLNSKCKLYDKAIFRERVLPVLLETLMQILFQKVSQNREIKRHFFFLSIEGSARLYKAVAVHIYYASNFLHRCAPSIAVPLQS